MSYPVKAKYEIAVDDVTLFVHTLETTVNEIASIDKVLLEHFTNQVMKPVPNRCYEVGDLRLSLVGIDPDEPSMVQFFVTRITPKQMKMF